MRLRKNWMLNRRHGGFSALPTSLCGRQKNAPRQSLLHCATSCIHASRAISALPTSLWFDRKRSRRFSALPTSLWVVLGILMLVSCSSQPQRDQKSLLNNVPALWTGAKTLHDPVASGWVTVFADAGLSSVVQEALTHNFDLQAAVARVSTAKEQALIAGAGRWPQLAFAPGYQESKQSYTAGSDDPQGCGECGKTPGAFSATTHTAAFAALFSLNWEIDLWGRIKAAQNAVQQDAEAVSADLQGARLSLAARTAQSYFELIEADLQIKVAEQSIQDRRVIADFVRGRFTRGLSRGLDLRLVLTDLANAEAQLAAARNRKQIVMRRLEVLLGRYPNGQLSNAVKLPEPPLHLSPGLPSELLERRPDLVAAYLRLRGMDFRVESAKKPCYRASP